MVKSAKNQSLNKILQNNGQLDYDEEKRLLKQVLTYSPTFSIQLTYFYFEKVHQYRKELDKIADELQGLSDSPWIPARCVTVFDSVKPPMALVAVDSGRRAVVALAKGVDPRSLNPGIPVLLNQKMNLIVQIWNGLPLNGEVAVFDRMHRDRIVVKTNGEAELVLDLCEDLKNETIQPGDPVLFDRSSRLALEKIGKPDGHEYFLEQTPEVTFEDIGGLDHIIQELVDYIDLHFFHPEIVRAHRLRPAKGILLVGKPGLGKTMLAKALANYCASMNDYGECKFMNIPAGSQRYWLYGATEARYRQIFAIAREATQENGGTRVIMFWDELDNIGHRSQNFGNDIDSRTMTTFLSELDGLESTENILVVGATNREDLIDPALKRPKRFGDRIFRIERPNQQAAAEIFSKYLHPDLPYYYCNGRRLSGKQMAEEIIETAVNHLYGPNSPRAKIATLTFRNGAKEEVRPADVVSGAMIENTVRKASYKSCVRALDGQEGITLEDVLDALDDELDSIAEQLKDIRTLHAWLDIDRDMDVVKVEIHPANSTTRPYQYVRSEV